MDAMESGLDYSEEDEDYLDEEEARKVLGYLLIAYPGMDRDGRVRFGSRPVRKFAEDWSNWETVRSLCANLPADQALDGLLEPFVLTSQHGFPLLALRNFSLKSFTVRLFSLTVGPDANLRKHV